MLVEVVSYLLGINSLTIQVVDQVQSIQSFIG